MKKIKFGLSFSRLMRSGNLCFFRTGDIIGTDGHDFPIPGRLVGRCPLVSVVGLDIKIVASVVRRSILLFEVEVDARRINVERK